MAEDDVSIRIGIDASNAERQHEEFVRKVESRRPLVTLGTDPGTRGHVADPGTAFRPVPTNSAGMDAAAAVVSSAMNRRAESERRLATANDRAADASDRRVRDLTARAQRAQDREFVDSLPGLPTRGDLRRAGYGEPGDGGGRGRGGRRRAVADEPDDDGGDDGGRRAGRGQQTLFGLRLGQLGRIGTAGTLARAGARAMSAYQTLDRELDLSIGDRGGEDSQRKYKAYVANADTVEGLVPIASELGGFIRESITGDRQYGQATIESAERQGREDDRRAKLAATRKGYQDYARGLGGRNYATLGEGDAEQATRSAAVARQEALTDARERYEATSRATPTAGHGKLESQYNDLTAGIESAFLKTTQRIRRSADVAYRALSDDVDISGERAANRGIAANRLSIVRETDRDADAQEDPRQRAGVRRRGAARVEAFDADAARGDAQSVAVDALARDMLVRHGSQDSRGELRASQALRRQRELGDWDFSTPGQVSRFNARSGLLDAQDASESGDYERNRSFRTRALRDERDVGALEANRQPMSAHAESIYRRAVLEADRDKADRPEDARLELQSARNQLLAFRATAFSGGTAREVDAGSFGPGGTEGTDQEGKDYTAALSRIETLLGKLDSSINALGGNSP